MTWISPMVLIAVHDWTSASYRTRHKLNAPLSLGVAFLHSPRRAVQHNDLLSSFFALYTFDKYATLIGVWLVP